MSVMNEPVMLHELQVTPSTMPFELAPGNELWNLPSSPGALCGQLPPVTGLDTPRPTVDDTTPMWRFGRPMPNFVSSTLTKFGKFCANSACLSAVDSELSITNKMSMSADTGMFLVAVPDCTGVTLEMLRSGQAA